jgi:hypothetical protein
LWLHIGQAKFAKVNEHATCHNSYGTMKWATEYGTLVHGDVEKRTHTQIRTMGFSWHPVRSDEIWTTAVLVIAYNDHEIVKNQKTGNADGVWAPK